MYRDLFDKHKHRTAFISEEYDYLYFAFEFRGSALPFNREKLIEKTEESFGGELQIYLEDNKKLVLQVKLVKPDLRLLYQMVIVLAYVVGKNVALEYYYRNFPYYTTDHHFNLHTHSPTSSRLLRLLLDNPAETIKILLELLNNENSYFNKLVVGIMQVNAFPFSEFIFVYEYGLLQGLAKNNKISGKLFTAENNPSELKLLEELSSEATQLLDKKYPQIAAALRKKFDVVALNSRGATKDQIKTFIHQFERSRIRGYERRLEEWNTFRSQTSIAHGGSVDVTDQKFIRAAEDLHDLLLTILADEVTERLNA